MRTVYISSCLQRGWSRDPTSTDATKDALLFFQGGCISKLEQFILDHLKIIGAVGVGIACVQVSAGVGHVEVLPDHLLKCLSSDPQIIGMVFTCCLYRNLKAEPY